MTLIQHIKNHIRQHSLIQPGETVVVGVSGGPDSVALLYILNQLKHELGCRIIVAHFNHKLRKKAGVDQQFVANLASQMRLPFYIQTSRIKNPSRSLEDWARDQRLKFFKQLIAKKKNHIIALAHHKNDLAETVLMRCIRGTGLQGLQAIQPKRTIEGMTVIRPLLSVERVEIEKFLSQKKIPFRLDHTNKNKKFFRNQIRLDLLPLLQKEYSAGIIDALANLANTTALDYEFLTAYAQKQLPRLMKEERGKLLLNAHALLVKHPAVQRLIIRLAFEQFQGNTKRLTLTHIKEIEDLLKNRPLGSIIHLANEVKIKKIGKYITIYK